MKYIFPEIVNISELEKVLAGCMFEVINHGDYLSITTSSKTTFPPIRTTSKTFEHDGRYGIYTIRHVDDTYAALTRELNGIIFDSRSGNLLRRPYHKFFELDQSDETRSYAVETKHPHIVLDKLDGEMIAPFVINGDLLWARKDGSVAEDVTKFVSTKRNSFYHEFAEECIDRDVTPIFEWCSKKNPRTVRYLEDSLVVTGMRNKQYGGYFIYDAMETITKRYPQLPLVASHKPINNTTVFASEVRQLPAAEGYVLRFHSGHMMSFKTDWYKSKKQKLVEVVT